MAGPDGYFSLMDISWSGKGLLQHTKLRLLIDTSVAGRRLEQLPIPFGAIATDVATGARVVIRKGPPHPPVPCEDRKSVV